MSADFWAGYISGAAGIIIGNPLDLVKVRLQAGQAATPAVGGALAVGSGEGSNGTQQAMRSSSVLQRTIRRTAALATGAAAPILGYGALNALLFVSYRQAERVLTPAPGFVADGDPAARAPAPHQAPPSPAAIWMAGAVAGLATWIVSTPTELIKCRAQLALGSSSSSLVASAGASGPASVSSWNITRQVWAAEGIRGFFLGGTVTALRDSIGYGFYFWSYMLMTEAWRRRRQGAATTTAAAGGDDSAPEEVPSHVATLLCGGLAGIVTWASVFPLDVIKTRVQSQALKPRGERAPLLGAQPAPPGTRLSTLQITAQAYRDGGLRVFFRGLGVCSARAFVVNAVQWAVYEWTMRELGGKR